MALIKGNLDDFPERALLALYLLQLQDGFEADEHYQVYVEGRGVAEMIGGRWSSYRHNKMLELQESGWVTVTEHPRFKSGKGKVYRYALTPTAFQTLKNRAIKALNGAMRFSTAQKQLFDILDNANNTYSEVN